MGKYKKLKEVTFDMKNNNIKSENESAKSNSNNSKNSKTGYMDTGNEGKIVSKQGTKNKN